MRDCDSRVEGGPLTPGPDDIRVGPITFYNLRNAAYQPSQDFNREPGFGLPWKTVTEVAANARVTLIVPRGERRHITLMYGGSGSAGRRGFRLQDGIAAVRLEACPPGEPRFSGSGGVGARTQFSGGFAVSGAGCYEVHMRLPGRPDLLRLDLAFGTGDPNCGR